MTDLKLTLLGRASKLVWDWHNREIITNSVVANDEAIPELVELLRSVTAEITAERDAALLRIQEFETQQAIATEDMRLMRHRVAPNRARAARTDSGPIEVGLTQSRTMEDIMRP